MKPLTVATVTTLVLMLASSTVSAEDSAQQSRSQQQQTEEKKKERPRMDVVFTIDATSSMADEIEVIKKEVWAIANRLVSGKPTPDIRFGLVLYRDKTDRDLVEVTPLTRDIDAIHSKLMAARAIGGGDKPEHVGQGLHSTLDLDWDLNPSVKRTIYLVGDAGPNNHEDYTVASALDRASQKNIAINTIGCSGLTSGERAEFTKIASRTSGAFEALTYYAVVEEDDGSKKSVVYVDGDMYETKGEISDEEWKKGGKKVVAKRKMKKASAPTRTKARSAKKKNNLDSVVEKDMMKSAESMGVAY